jgi:hypothetical protein
VLQAAIASLHAEAATYDVTDWPQILRLYDELLMVWPFAGRGPESFRGGVDGVRPGGGAG